MNPIPKTKRTKLTPAQYKKLCEQVWKRDRGVCQLCGRFTVVPEFHHAVFRSQGGGDEVDNVLILCHECHHVIHHGPRHSAEYRQRAVERMREINAKGSL